MTHELSCPRWPRPKRRTCYPSTQTRSSPFLYKWIQVWQNCPCLQSLHVDTGATRQDNHLLFPTSFFKWISGVIGQTILPSTHGYPLLWDRRYFPSIQECPMLWAEDPSPLHMDTFPVGLGQVGSDDRNSDNRAKSVHMQLQLGRICLHSMRIFEKILNFFQRYPKLQ